MLVPELVIDFMERLQPRGICFAMDNFGSGQMAIRYFKDFDFDILKIDGQFMRGIASNPDNQAVVRSLFSIAREFDMLTVAEPIETHADPIVAQQIGIDCLQGYFFCSPHNQAGLAPCAGWPRTSLISADPSSCRVSHHAVTSRSWWGQMSATLAFFLILFATIASYQEDRIP